MMNHSTELPLPPPGYQPPLQFHYPKLALQLASILLVVGLTPLLLVVSWLFQGQPAGGGFRLDSSSTAVALVTLLLLIPVHELIHGVTYQLLGYRVTYGASLHLMAAYAGAFQQWQRRDHNLLVALAPLLLLTLLLLPCLASSSSVVWVIGFTGLLFNTGGAVGDLYLIWRLLRFPRQTLLYDHDPQTMLIYLPEQASGAA